ncbi:hypothetical protein CSC31_2505 [Pseudomonas aeruginosa]|nr:hypothetical protein CSC31_2505 [Pseudomonas aeruginosa]
MNGIINVARMAVLVRIAARISLAHRQQTGKGGRVSSLCRHD